MEHPRYILSKRIARGGMAEIYLGKQVGEDGFSRICAIKRILPHFAQDAEFVEMFRDEAHICKRLQHANIIRVEGFEEVEGSYAIIMELVSGADLRALLAACEKSGNLVPIAVACYIIAEAARGLHFAHTKIDEITSKPLDIVHRDISPQNILLSFEGEIKVTDFGIADADNKMTETKPGVVKGKYAYMSPEQISGKPVDARTDVFALSIVLWEMLTMRRLFQGENEVETINLVRTCKIPSPMSQFNRDITAELEEIVLKGLAREKKLRYQSAGDLEIALRVYLNQKFPSFTSKDVASLMKLVLSKRIQESQEDIKKALTETSQKPNQAPRAHNPAAPMNERLANAIAHGHNLEAPPSLAMAPRSPVTRANAKLPNQFSSGHSTNTRAGIGGISHNTGMLRPNSHSGFQKERYYSKSSKKKGIGTQIAIGALMVIAVVVGGLGYVVKARRTPDVYLVTTPPAVKLSYNQTSLFGGKYVESPIIVHDFPEGKGTISIAREGYETVRFSVTHKRGKQIKNESIVLKQIDKFAPVKILSKKNGEKVDFDINDGFVKGTTPMNAPDLTYGKNHIMQIFPESFNKPENVFWCKFTPTSVDYLEPFILVIDVEKRGCRQSKR